MERIFQFSQSIKAKTLKTPIKVLITGAAGSIGYVLSFMVAQGTAFGFDQPIELCLLDIPSKTESLKGVEYEIIDCAFPLISKLVATSDEKLAFTNCDYAILVGAMPRMQGMERNDLLEKNVAIFKNQAILLDSLSKPTVKVLVVGNPANTNAFVIAQNAKRINKKNISALTRLDENRAYGQLAEKLKINVNRINNVAIWGNHSTTQYPDIQKTKFEKNSIHQNAKKEINDSEWILKQFIPTVQKRGAEIIRLRKLSSAASAASAVIDHLRDWHLGTVKNQVRSMAVWSTGNPYGIKNDLIFSFPVVCKKGTWEFAKEFNLKDETSQKFISETTKELEDEKNIALKFLEKKN